MLMSCTPSGITEQRKILEMQSDLEGTKLLATQEVKPTLEVYKNGSGSIPNASCLVTMEQNYQKGRYLKVVCTSCCTLFRALHI